MINKLLYLSGILIAVFGLLFGASNASAAVGSESGLMTLFNPTTKQHILVHCVDGQAKTVVAVIDGEAHQTGVSMNTPCSPLEFDGYRVKFNLDPRDGGWVLMVGDERMMGAYACTRYGAVFAESNPPDERLFLFARDGYCGPGAVPG